MKGDRMVEIKGVTRTLLLATGAFLGVLTVAGKIGIDDLNSAVATIRTLSKI
jgi:uncharacterized membrane protein